MLAPPIHSKQLRYCSIFLYCFGRINPITAHGDGQGNIACKTNIGANVVKLRYSVKCWQMGLVAG